MTFTLASLASVEVSYLHAIIYTLLAQGTTRMGPSLNQMRPSCSVRLVPGEIDAPWHFSYHELTLVLVIQSTEWVVGNAAAFRATQATETNTDSGHLVRTNHPTLRWTVSSPYAVVTRVFVSGFLVVSFRNKGDLP